MVATCELTATSLSCACCQSPRAIRSWTWFSSVRAASATWSSRTCLGAPKSMVRRPYRASPGPAPVTTAPKPPIASTAAAAAPTTLRPRRLRWGPAVHFSRFSRLTLVGLSARPAFSAVIASASEIRPVAGGKRISSRQPPSSAASSASAAPCGVTGRPVASASMKSSVLRMASSEGSSRKSGPRESDIVELRSVDLGL